MKTLIVIIIFIAQVWNIKYYVSFNNSLHPTVDLNNELITIRSHFEHKKTKWTSINKDSLKLGKTYYYVLEENFSAKIIIQKYRQ